MYFFVSYFKSFLLIFSSYFWIPTISYLISLFFIYFGKSPSIDSRFWLSSDFKGFRASTCFCCLILNCLYFLCKCFTEWRIYKSGLFCYSPLMRRWYFFTCIFINFTWWWSWYSCCFSVDTLLWFLIFNLIINCDD